MSRKNGPTPPATPPPGPAAAAAAAGEILDANGDCRACGSAEHTPYVDQGEPLDIDATRITWRRTSCSACGQARVNRFGRPVPQSRARLTK